MDQNGKKPLEKKKPAAKAVASSYDDIFGNPLKLSAELLEELDAKGLVGRFGDYKKLKDSDGYNPKGWQVYRRTSSDKSLASDFNASPDGIIRRGSCVLMVKTKEAHRKHRDYLDDAAASYGRASRKQAADRMKQQAKQARISTSIVDGYDD